MHPIYGALIARDAAAFAAEFAVDGVFHSPLVNNPGVLGRTAIAELMRAVFAATSDFELTTELADSRTAAIGYTVRFGRTTVKGMFVAELDDRELVREFWVYARPLVGVVGIARVLGPGLISRINPVLGALTRIANLPLVAIAFVTDFVGGMVVRGLNRWGRRQGSA